MARRRDSSNKLVDRWQRIQKRIEQNRENLMQQGSITARQSGARRVWLLRFIDEVGGQRVQRAIYLGGDDQMELVTRARDLLDYLRLLGRFHQQLAEDCRTARNLLRAMRSLCREISGS